MISVCTIVTILAKCAIVAIVILVAICSFGDARDVENWERGGGCRDAIVALFSNIMVD